MSVLDCFLTYIIAYGAIRAVYEVYLTIRLYGFERGLEAAEPIIEQATQTAYRLGRIHERAAVQSEVHAIYKEAYRQGRLSTIAPTVFERN